MFDEDIELEELEDLPMDAIDEEAARIDRRHKREWETIIDKLTIIMHHAHEGRFEIVCKNGHKISLEYDAASDEDIRTMGVLSEDSGEYESVPTPDVILRIWDRGGVDLPRSREATKALGITSDQ